MATAVPRDMDLSAFKNKALSLTPSQLAEFLSSTIPAKLPVLIVGSPGIGKTDIGKQSAQKAAADLHIWHPVVDAPIDYKGFPFVDASGNAEFKPYGHLRLLIDAKKLTVVILDDLGQAPPAVQAAAMQLLLERRINGHRISDHVVFIACTNRKEDKAGVAGILEPVKSRFVAIVQLIPSWKDWNIWAIGAGLPPDLIAFNRLRPHWIEAPFVATADMRNSPCPRTIHNVGKLRALNLPPELEFTAYAGAAGEPFAIEYMAFLKVFRKMQDPYAIIMHPEKAYVPKDSEPSLTAAVCGALANLVSDQTFPAICRYAERLDKDFANMLVDDCLTKCPGIQATTAWQKWTANNHNFITGRV